MSSFILPTLFSVFIGIWYYVIMAELLVLEDVPLHVFTCIARVFYGSLISFPFDLVLRVIISRIVMWVIIFVLALDMVQLVVILGRFNSFMLADALSILFAIIFIIMDLFFMLNLYHLSTEGQLEMHRPPKAEIIEKPKKAVEPPIIVVEEDSDSKISSLRHRIKF